MSGNILENSTVRLRAPELDDVDLLYSWENNMGIWKVSNTLTPFSRFVLKKYIETSHLDIWESKQLRLIIEAKAPSTPTDIPVGLIDLFDFDPFHLRAGIGILIANRVYRNKGYASEALDLLIRYSFEVLQLNQLYCNISADNTTSIKLFRSKGFEAVGTKKAWLKTRTGWEDEVMLQCITPNPRIPR